MFASVAALLPTPLAWAAARVPKREKRKYEGRIALWDYFRCIFERNQATLCKISMTIVENVVFSARCQDL